MSETKLCRRCDDEATEYDDFGDLDLCWCCHEEQEAEYAKADAEIAAAKAYDDLCLEMDEYPDKFKCDRCSSTLRVTDWLYSDKLCVCGNCGRGYARGEVENMAVVPV